MIISDFTKPELDYLLEHCGFDEAELPVFTLRSHGASLQDISVLLGITIDSVKKISRRVNKKIIEVL